MKRKVQAQRKFAAGAYIPPSAASNAAPERRPEPAPRGDIRNVIYNHLSAEALLDMIAFNNLHAKHRVVPVVVIERLRDTRRVSAAARESRAASPPASEQTDEDDRPLNFIAQTLRKQSLRKSPRKRSYETFTPTSKAPIPSVRLARLQRVALRRSSRRQPASVSGRPGSVKFADRRDIVTTVKRRTIMKPPPQNKILGSNTTRRSMERRLDISPPATRRRVAKRPSVSPVQSPAVKRPDATVKKTSPKPKATAKKPNSPEKSLDTSVKRPDPVAKRPDPVIKKVEQTTKIPVVAIQRPAKPTSNAPTKNTETEKDKPTSTAQDNSETSISVDFESPIESSCPPQQFEDILPIKHSLARNKTRKRSMVETWLKKVTVRPPEDVEQDRIKFKVPRVPIRRSVERRPRTLSRRSDAGSESAADTDSMFSYVSNTTARSVSKHPHVTHTNSVGTMFPSPCPSPCLPMQQQALPLSDVDSVSPLPCFTEMQQQGSNTNDVEGDATEVESDCGGSRNCPDKSTVQSSVRADERQLSSRCLNCDPCASVDKMRSFSRMVQYRHSNASYDVYEFDSDRDGQPSPATLFRPTRVFRPDTRPDPIPATSHASSATSALASTSYSPPANLDPGASIPAVGASTPAVGASIPTPGASIPTPGAAISVPGAAISVPGASIPAPGASVPALGALIPPKGASIPAPGTSVPAPTTNASTSARDPQIVATPTPELTGVDSDTPYVQYPQYLDLFPLHQQMIVEIMLTQTQGKPVIKARLVPRPPANLIHQYTFIENNGLYDRLCSQWMNGGNTTAGGMPLAEFPAGEVRQVEPSVVQVTEDRNRKNNVQAAPVPIATGTTVVQGDKQTLSDTSEEIMSLLCENEDNGQINLQPQKLAKPQNRRNSVQATADTAAMGTAVLRRDSDTPSDTSEESMRLYYVDDDDPQIDLQPQKRAQQARPHKLPQTQRAPRALPAEQPLLTQVTQQQTQLQNSPQLQPQVQLQQLVQPISQLQFHQNPHPQPQVLLQPLQQPHLQLRSMQQPHLQLRSMQQRHVPQTLVQLQPRQPLLQQSPRVFVQLQPMVPLQPQAPQTSPQGQVQSPTHLQAQSPPQLQRQPSPQLQTRSSPPPQPQPKLPVQPSTSRRNTRRSDPTPAQPSKRARSSGPTTGPKKPVRVETKTPREPPPPPPPQKTSPIYPKPPVLPGPSATTAKKSDPPAPPKKSAKKGNDPPGPPPENNYFFSEGDNGFRDAPVFYPTEEEFTDPLAFFGRISQTASKFGLCKVVSPASFRATCALAEDVRFNVSNQYLSRLYSRWGAASREMCAIKAYLADQKVYFTRPPLIDGIELNLPKLYRTVQLHGGLVKVIEKKRWARVAEDMRFPRGPRSAQRVDQLYVKHLLPYDTLSNAERTALLERVDKSWRRNYMRMVRRASNPLHRQKRLLEELASSEDSDSDEDAHLAVALAEAEDCVVAGRHMKLSVFKKVAENVMCTLFTEPEPTPAQVEQRYWELVGSAAEHVCVNSASIDTGEEGYGFTRYHKHPWNLKNLSQNSANVLRSLGPVLGVTVPTLHLGMVLSTSCWHRDPHGLPWVEYLHQGPAKIWYGIPDKLSGEFRSAVEDLCPTAAQNKSIWLPSDITMIPPRLLADRGVPLSRVVQRPGEFIVVLPKAYSSSISTGYTQSESVYFATKSWLEDVADVFQELHDSCEPTMFSLEQLLLAVALDPRSEADVLEEVEPTLTGIVRDEIHFRRALIDMGVEFAMPETPPTSCNRQKKKPAGAWNVREQDECEVCRTTLYLSKVTGLTSKRSSFCLEHALRVLQKQQSGPETAGLATVFVLEADLEDALMQLRTRLQGHSAGRNDVHNEHIDDLEEMEQSVITID